MFYLSIESKGRGAKEETRRKFDLATVSSLNTILSQKDEIIRFYETNQATSKRVRLTGSRLPSLDDRLYDKFVQFRSQNIEVRVRGRLGVRDSKREIIMNNSFN